MPSSISWMKKSIDLHANGKLLLTGEYLVVAGAIALALPIRFGQTLHAEYGDHQSISWISMENGVSWFTCEMDPVSLTIKSASDHTIARRLKEILSAARLINPGFLKEDGISITMSANYPLKWGLGSSSTLIALIAEWAHVDKYILFRMVSRGSGYDIACTDRDSMFFYRLKDGKINITDARPGNALINHACFAYSGKKQATAEELSAFLSETTFTDANIERISELSCMICNTDDPLLLCSRIDEHEEILGRILRKEPVSKHFQDFPGSIKSLGAWGGDFAMFVSEIGNEFIKTWLKQNGFSVVFCYEELKISV